jgi:hypothetical protein
MTFLVLIEAIDATMLTKFMAQLPSDQRTAAREAGLQRARKGAAQMIIGAAIWISQGMKPANARLITAALRDTRDVWAGYILPEDRGQAIAVLAELQKVTTDNEVRSNVTVLARTLAAAK